MCLLKWQQIKLDLYLHSFACEEIKRMQTTKKENSFILELDVVLVSVKAFAVYSESSYCSFCCLGAFQFNSQSQTTYASVARWNISRKAVSIRWWVHWKFPEIPHQTTPPFQLSNVKIRKQHTTFNMALTEEKCMCSKTQVTYSNTGNNWKIRKIEVLIFTVILKCYMSTGFTKSITHSEFPSTVWNRVQNRIWKCKEIRYQKIILFPESYQSQNRS